MCYEHEQLGVLFSYCSLFLLCLLLQTVASLICVEGIREVVELLTNRNSGTGRASEHIAARASNVAPKNTGEALAAAPAQTATVPAAHTLY